MNSLGCCLLRRMSCQIDLRERRLFGGADCPSERPFVTTLQVVNGQEVDAVSAGTRYPRGIFKARVEGPCVRWLTQVEPFGADMKDNCNAMIPGHCRAGREQRAGNDSNAKDRPPLRTKTSSASLNRRGCASGSRDGRPLQTPGFPVGSAEPVWQKLCILCLFCKASRS